MSDGKPLFLAKSSYRSRRLSDAARLLPVVATFLLALPATWATPAPGKAELSGDLVYLFVVWAGLILAALLIARRLAGAEPAGQTPAQTASEVPAAATDATTVAGGGG